MPHVEQELTLVELISEVDHQKHRVVRIEAAIDRAIAEAPERLRKIVEALQALRGVAKLTAVTLAVELGSFIRFQKASQVMSYTGMTSSEYSSGSKRRQGAITKAGNSHLRRALVEAAWQYRHPPRLMQRQKKMIKEWPAPVADTAWRAQQRLHRRYWRSEEHTSELQSRENLVCRLLLEKKNECSTPDQPSNGRHVRSPCACLHS